MDQNGINHICIYFVKHQGQNITSAELAEKLGVTNKTIKTNMSLVDQNFRRNGAQIQARTNAGYQLLIRDPEKYRKFSAELEIIDYYQMTVDDVSDMQSMVKILRALLESADQKKVVREEDLAERMYLSPRAFRQIYQKCNYYLGSYNLFIHKYHSKGSILSGSEFDLRMAYLSIAGVSSSDNEEVLDDSSFYHQTKDMISSEAYQQIRSSALDILRSSGYSIRDDTPRGLTHYLVIMTVRLRKGKHLNFKKDQILLLKGTEEYDIASRIFSSALKNLHEIPEEEIAALALYLMSNHDFAREEIESRDLLHLAGEIGNLYMNALYYLHVSFGMEETETVENRYLYSILAKLIIRRKFNTSSYGSLLGSYHISSAGSYIIAQHEARMFLLWLEKELNCYLNQQTLTMLTYYFQQAQDQVSLEKQKKKVVTISPLGKQYAEILIERVNERYGELIASNKAAELYELRNVPAADVDLVIFDNNVLSYYHYAFSVFVLRQDNFNELGKYLENQNKVVELADRINRMVLTDAADEKHSEEQWIQKLVSMHAGEKTDQKQLVEMITASNQRSHYNQFGRVVYIGIPVHYATQEVIHIIHCIPGQKWMGNPVSDIVFFAMPSDPVVLKAMGTLLSYLGEDVKRLNAFSDQQVYKRYQDLCSLLISEK